MRQRSVAIDIVRVAGIVAVVMGHLWVGQADDPNLLRISLYSWHVPLFFFLTGYFWTPGRSLRSEVTSRARALLLPYAVWTVALGVPLYVFMSVRTGFPGGEIALTLYGGGLLRGYFAPYWFLPVLFFSAVLFRALDRVPRWIVWVAALLGLAATYVWGLQLSRLPQDFFFALPCLVFMLTGHELRHKQSRVFAPKTTGSILLLGSAALLATGAASPLDMKLGDFGTPILGVLVACAICAGLVLLVQGLVGNRQFTWGPLVTELATVSTVVLLTHTFAFVVLDALGAPQLIVFVGSLVATFVLGLIIHRTALSPWLAGVPQSPQRGWTESTSEPLAAEHDPTPRT